jgi:hypothetical protein
LQIVQRREGGQQCDAGAFTPVKQDGSAPFVSLGLNQIILRQEHVDV